MAICPWSAVQSVPWLTLSSLMKKATNFTEIEPVESSQDLLTEIVRESARKVLALALALEDEVAHRSRPSSARSRQAASATREVDCRLDDAPGRAVGHGCVCGPDARW